MIEEEGAGFDEIDKMWPSISEEGFEEFKAIEATTAKQRQWGKDMQKKNVAPHNLGSRGYARKEPMWKKEDARREGPNPYDKIKDPPAKKNCQGLIQGSSQIARGASLERQGEGT